jgi:hypothetical protein
VTADTAGVFHRADPVRLRQARRNRGVLAAELIGSGDREHRVPVDGRVIVGRGGLAGRRHGGDVQPLAGPGSALRAVNKTVSASPHVVVRRRQVGHDESPAVVGDNDLDVADGQITRFRDHPHPRLGPFRSGDHAADVVVVDRHIGSRLLGAGRDRQIDAERREGKRQNATQEKGLHR